MYKIENLKTQMSDKILNFDNLVFWKFRIFRYLKIWKFEKMKIYYSVLR